MEIVDVEDGQADPTAATRKKSLWAKINNRTTYSYLFNIVISILLLTCLVLVLYFFKEYLKNILYWVDAQDPKIIFLLFMGLFLIVSFPVTIGYLVLIITSGYLFGILKGLGTVVVSANFGVAVAHFTLKMLRGYLPLDRLLKNDTARALLKVISGPQAFKIVFFARLTPIPFGLQNTIFAVSDVRGCGYHLATLLGLLPAQVINVYLGSTLRSMHDVLHESHLTGYIVFAFQVLCALLFYANGDYQRVVGEANHFSQEAMSVYIKEVTEALNNQSILKCYIKFPVTQQDRNVIKQSFYNKYQIPGVIGCIDGSHFKIVKPKAEIEHLYYCRKHYHSLNVQIILIGITLMVWVVQKARKELTIAIMAAELGRDTLSTSSSSS